MFQNKEVAAMMVYETNPPRIAAGHVSEKVLYQSNYFDQSQQVKTAQ